MHYMVAAFLGFGMFTTPPPTPPVRPPERDSAPPTH
jgi:hypothetical protein